MTPGIHAVSTEAYHAGPGVSKTGLWTLWQKSPAHMRFGEHASSPTFDLGSAAHCAVLEPGEFEVRYRSGPVDRRGNKWVDAVAEAEAQGFTVLTSGDYDRALRMRDSAARSSTTQTFTRGAVFERAAYAEDAETGMLVRCKPDAWSPALSAMIDLKSTFDASPDAFAKSVLNYGYHVQEAFYSDVWSIAANAPVEAFAFVAVEKTAPYQVACYELDPETVAEGRAIYRQALDVYARCFKAEAAGMSAERAWPGYPDTPTTIRLPRYGFRLTTPENQE